MSAEDVAKAFVQHYYTTFDTNRAGLAVLYVRVAHAVSRLCCRLDLLTVRSILTATVNVS